MASAAQHASFDWWGTLRLNVFIAIGVFLLLLATNQQQFDSEFVLRTLFTTFIYTFCIGTPSFYTISQVIEPITFSSEAVVWSLVVLSSLGLAVVGAAMAQTI